MNKKIFIGSLSTVFLLGLFISYLFADVTKSEKKLLDKFYSTKRLESEKDKEIELSQYNKALADRPRELKERRWVMVPLVYEEIGSYYSYGLDLPEPSYEWCSLKEENQAFPKGTLKIKVVRIEDRRCWGLLLYNPKWNIVPPHGSIVVLTIPAIVKVPK